MLLVKLIVALVVILAMVSYYGYDEYKASSEKPQFPPFVSKCPDYWDVVGENRCRNVNKLGICLHGDGTKDSDVMDFNLPIFEGKKGMYYKCSWAQKCQVPWEGISNLCA
jgi:hypothetical protein